MVYECFRLKFYAVCVYQVNTTMMHGIRILIGPCRRDLNLNNVVTVRNEVAKVMFLQACVCPQGGGVCSGGVSAPRGGVCSRGVGICSGGVSALHWDTPTPPPGETATAADGTHPIGMHSCLLNKIVIPLSNLVCLVALFVQ